MGINIVIRNLNTNEVKNITVHELDQIIVTNNELQLNGQPIGILKMEQEGTVTEQYIKEQRLIASCHDYPNNLLSTIANLLTLLDVRNKYASKYKGATGIDDNNKMVMIHINYINEEIKRLLCL